MATIFADSFDVYGSTTDMLTSSGGLWTFPGFAGSLSGTSTSNTQFGVGQSYQPTTNTSGNLATFTSATNESTIYGSYRLLFSNGFNSSTSNGFSFSFTDGSTVQCTMRFRQDGSIALYSGTTSGTLLYASSSLTYNPAVWNSFQFKIVVNNTTGSFEIRLNGSSSSIVNQSSLNNRGGTSNNYATGIFIQGSASGSLFIDDVYLNNTSGNNPVSWPGDLRAVQQIPATATTSNFTATSTYSTVIAANFGSQTMSAGTVEYMAWTPSRSGAISSVTVRVNTSATANVKLVLYNNANGGAPGTPLATSNVLTNPTSGNNTITFASPPSVTAGTTYFLAYDQDASVTYNVQGVASSYFGTTAYASFPATNPTGLTGPTGTNSPTTTVNLSMTNAQALQDAIEDGDTTYMSSSTVQEDTFTVSAIPSSYSVIACQYYIFWKKSDAGARTAQLSVDANSSGDTAEITNSSLTTSYQYQFKILEKDPAGSYWTATTANGQVLGIAVTA